MPVPDFQSLMLPALRLLAQGDAHAAAAVRAALAAEFRLSDDDIAQLLPSIPILRMDEEYFDRF